MIGLQAAEGVYQQPLHLTDVLLHCFVHIDASGGRRNKGTTLGNLVERGCHEQFLSYVQFGLNQQLLDGVTLEVSTEHLTSHLPGLL